MTTSTILSPNRYDGRAAAVRVIVMHTMEAPEGPSTAENIARYFAKPSTKASAHVCGDNNSTVRCVPDSGTAWAAPGANADGLQYELAGYARQTAAEWADAYSVAALELAAQQCAEWVRKYGIPIRHLSPAELKAGARGFVAHDDVSKAYKKSSHWDPGPAFPWASFLARVAALTGGAAPVVNPVPAPAPSNVVRQGSRGSLVSRVQSFLGIPADGIFGAQTHAAVVAYQRALGLTPDGIVGAQTWAAINAGRRPAAGPSPRNAAQTVATQKALQGAKQDGYWGDDTDMRVNLVRAAINGHFPGGSGAGGVQGVKDAQWVVWAAADGIWGPKSAAALKATIAKLQAAWGVAADGIWGPKTEAAYVAARTRNYKTW